MMCIDIDIIDDLICEGLEYFGTQLTTNDPNVALGTSSGTVNIIDNDGKYSKCFPFLCARKVPTHH